ncbi:MAG TPA: hypothetical protein VLB44_26105 [Kofleriaceae bacterium]|nr:hypothetical protein [Kofleriaceae bacterium]
MNKRVVLQVAAVLTVALVVAGGAGFTLFGRHGTKVKAPRIYTCAELEPEHAKAEGDASRNYTAALAATGLHEIELRADDIGLDGHADFPEDLDKQFGRPLKTGAVLSYTNADGKQLAAYVGEAVRFDYGPSDMHFAIDGRGGIWHVVRKPRVVPLRTVYSKGCAWGCWGLAPPGMAPPQTYHRVLWLLPDGATFAGEVTIEYDAPALDEHPTEDCGLPG